MGLGLGLGLSGLVSRCITLWLAIHARACSSSAAISTFRVGAKG